MAGINKAIILGRVGKDPETRNFQNGGRVVSFSVATSEKWKDRDGNAQERTTWHSVVIFNEKLGEIADKYLRKGSEVYVEGQIETRKYEKNGEDRYVTEIVLRPFRGEIALIGGARNGGGDTYENNDGGTYRDPDGGGGTRQRSGGSGGGGWSTGAARDGGGSGRAPAKSDLDDDIPF